MEPLPTVILLLVGAFIGVMSTFYFPVVKREKKDPPADLSTLETKIESNRVALGALLREFETLKTSGCGRISRVDNKDLFDRIESLEKNQKVEAIIRHEHFYTELPKATPPPKKKPLGKGVTNLFPNNEL